MNVRSCTPEPVTQPVVGYIRVSTDQQAAHGHSLAAQRSHISRWAEARDHRLICVYSDRGLSGKRADNRPGLQGALDRSCEVGGVLVATSLDRLARSTLDAIKIAEQLRAAGAGLALTSGEVDTTSPHGEFQFTLLAALGQLERRLIAKRTKDALAEKRRQGRRWCRVAPYGYRWSEGMLEVEPREQGPLRRMRKLRAGGMSWRAIADRLNSDGVPARSGRSWVHTSVRSVVNLASRCC